MRRELRSRAVVLLKVTCSLAFALGVVHISSAASQCMKWIYFAARCDEATEALKRVQQLAREDTSCESALAMQEALYLQATAMNIKGE